MSKKILFISSTVQFYENFLYETINRLSKNNEIIIVTNTENQTYDFKNIILKHLYLSRSINPFKDIHNTYQLGLYLNLIKPDIIISSSPKGGLIATLANFFFQIPRIHILTGIIWSDKNKNLLGRITKAIDLLNFKYSKKIYVDSESQIKFLLDSNFSQNKFSLIYKGSIKGVDLEKFRFKTQEKRLKNMKFNLSSNTLIILFLGRISPEKGIETFLSVIKDIVNDGFDIKGFIVGRDEKNILRNYKKHNLDFDHYFRYFEYTNNPEFFLKSADLVLIPSSREGFCQVAIEASACQVPVIGFDVIGLKDSIKNDVSGFLVPYNEKLKLIEKIKILLKNEDLRLQIGEQGREFVKNNFNKHEVIDNLIKQINHDLKLYCHD